MCIHTCIYYIRMHCECTLLGLHITGAADSERPSSSHAAQQADDAQHGSGTSWQQKLLCLYLHTLIHVYICIWWVARQRNWLTAETVVSLYEYTHTHKHKHTQTCICIHIHIYTYMNICIHIHIYTYMICSTAAHLSLRERERDRAREGKSERAGVQVRAGERARTCAGSSVKANHWETEWYSQWKHSH